MPSGSRRNGTSSAGGSSRAGASFPPLSPSPTALLLTSTSVERRSRGDGAGLDGGYDDGSGRGYFSRPSTADTVRPSRDYFRAVETPSDEPVQLAEPKSKLLICDLDNTLFGPSGSGVVARQFLKTFVKYVMNRGTPYNLALWTFSGRQYGIAHLCQSGVAKFLFADNSLDAPDFKPGLLGYWGFEDSGFVRPGRMACGKPVKDLDLMWDFISLTRGEEYGSSTSLLVDDQASNARVQPYSLVKAPVFTSKCSDDEFLLALIGVLEELAFQANIASTISLRHLYDGIDPGELQHYIEKAEAVCGELGIKVDRGTPYSDPALIEAVERNQAPVPSGPIHDAAEEPAAPHPGALPFSRPSPHRVADGMILHPSSSYLGDVAVPTRPGKVGKPLVVFDLDGTLYTRPPQNLEHDPNGEPAGRPYLRTFLQWLFRDESPWSVAIWTGSQKLTACRCLFELELGLVGPSLVGPNLDQAELLHPKLVALWAREDIGLTPKDYVSYVSIVKNFDKLWRYLRDQGHSFNSFNTVMVDDTPSKLRAQPYTLIAAPTFDYPLVPSPATSTALLDTFLLTLVAMLAEIEGESNFANYVEEEGWNVVMEKKRSGKYERRGVRALKKAGVPIAAEGRGAIAGVSPSVSDRVQVWSTPEERKGVQVFRLGSSASRRAAVTSRPPRRLLSDAPSGRQNASSTGATSDTDRDD